MCYDAQTFFPMWILGLDSCCHAYKANTLPTELSPQHEISISPYIGVCVSMMTNWEQFHLTSDGSRTLRGEIEFLAGRTGQHPKRR